MSVHVWEAKTSNGDVFDMVVAETEEVAKKIVSDLYPSKNLTLELVK